MPLHREVLSDHIGAQLVALALRHHRAFRHNDVLLCQARGKMEALLYQQNGKPARLFEPDDDVLDLVDDRRLNAFRGFIKQQELRA